MRKIGLPEAATHMTEVEGMIDSIERVPICDLRWRSTHARNASLPQTVSAATFRGPAHGVQADPPCRLGLTDHYRCCAL